VGVLGPRQCGKTTLAREYSAAFGKRRGAVVTHFDLENPADLALLERPRFALEGLRGLIVLDEVQRRPDLFPVLRVVVDSAPRGTRFLILGSASPALLQQGSESLAGRLAFMELSPFTAAEAPDLERLWLRGGFPRSYLASSARASADWREAYVATFLERDVPSLGVRIPAQQLRRLWQMLAHHHGQTLNASELGRSLDLSYMTIRRHLDVLTDTFMMRQLQPWFENIGKRQVKAPKVYVRDSGLLHSLLGCKDRASLLHHPKLGASWEGFALEAIIRLHDATASESFFWATHADAEIDLLLVRDGRRDGFEFKFTDAPRATRSMHVALAELRLDSLTVVTPGGKAGALSDGIRTASLAELTQSGRPGRKMSDRR
jgi:hypothetical protein